jgi:excinuclease ABC subunit C
MIKSQASILAKAKALPLSPGCYLFKGKNNEILYVGKAKKIRQRVAWYFKPENQGDKTGLLVKEAKDIDFIATDNELEALLLEAQLIKIHQPKYNIELKSGSRYAYLMFTKEAYPRLITIRNPKTGDAVFGPYASGQARQEMIRLACRLFKIRIGGKLNKKDEKSGKIKLATSPWIEIISANEYKKRVDVVALLLKGNSEALVEQLKKEMKVFSKNQEYEMAQARLDQIDALQRISEKQKVQLRRRYNQDVVVFAQGSEKMLIQLLSVNKGVVVGKKTIEVPLWISGERSSQLADFIRQYYFTNEIPQEIIVSENLPELELLEKYLTKLSGHNKVIITVPKRGNKLKLLGLLQKNAQISLKGEPSLLELKQVLNLTVLPKVIECFDISNLGTSGVVASMVQFLDGKPNKKEYRKFKIKSFKGQSDVDAMSEVVWRRYNRLVQEKKSLPDLVMVDGGKPQLSAASQSLKKVGVDLPLIALAKREEEIFRLDINGSLALPKNNEALKLLQRIRDEAHRFAVTYQRVIRSKRT